MNTFKLKDWNDITVKQFYLIRDLLEEPDDYTTFNIIDLLYGVDSANMTLQELKLMLNQSSLVYL